MPDIQTKVGEGFSKLQSNLEVSKQIQQLKKKQQVVIQKKSELLIKLGESCYRDIRHSSQAEGEYLDITETLVASDQELFEIGIKIEELQAEKGMKCSCGASINSSDKFCGNCGMKAEVFNAIPANGIKSCAVCNTENNTENKYCICCGKQFASLNNI